MFARRLRWAFLLIAVLLAATTATGWAAECSLETLKGGYGLDERGTIVALSPPLPFVTSGIIFYDGKGKISGSETTNLNGEAMPGTFAGTYAVNSDCTYSDSVVVSPSGAHLNHKGTIVGDGMLREVQVVGTDPGVVSAATIKKTPVGRCSLATLKGTYGVLEQGTVVASNPSLPPIPPPFLVVLSANPTFDGKGHVSGTFTATFGGFPNSGTFTGTYEVTPDCAYSDELVPHPEGGSPLPPIHHTGSITGEGILQESLYIYSDAGTVISGAAKKQ